VLESVDNKAEYPLPDKLVNKMKAQDQSVRAPIMMRIFKEEGVLEVWKAKNNGRYALVKEYEICKWSGKLGPKIKEGDRQAPEGYYEIKPYQMNPKSNYYLSFNIGYPNAFDRSLGRTGSNLMVHGACSSAGCYSMTDEQVLEIYAFARDAFRGGQPSFQVQAYPFRMTAENMARHHDNENYEFWEMLKVGYDHFELTKRPPKVDVCDRKYVFNQVALDGEEFKATQVCPVSETPQSLRLAYDAYLRKYDERFEVALKKEQKKKESELASILPKKEETAPQTPAPEAPEAPGLNARFASTTPATAALVNPEPAPEAKPVEAVAQETPSAESEEQPGAEAVATGEDPASQKTWWKIWKR
jgi:murein L,D-transpeptidase YafK